MQSSQTLPFRSSIAESSIWKIVCNLFPDSSIANTVTTNPTPCNGAVTTKGRSFIMIHWVVPSTQPKWFSNDFCRILVFDSSFNPPTQAHQKLIQVSFNLGTFDGVLLILSLNNADKGGMTENERQHRLEMIKLFSQCLNIENVALATTVRAAFFRDKLKLLKSQVCSDHGKFWFILGEDTLTRLMDPKYYTDFDLEMADFFQQSMIVCAKRSGATISSSLLHHAFLSSSLTWVDIGAENLDVASSHIRQRIHHPANNSNPLPIHPEIRDYIQTHSLYK